MRSLMRFISYSYWRRMTPCCSCAYFEPMAFFRAPMVLPTQSASERILFSSERTIS